MKRILIVDDNDEILDSIQLMIELEGYHTKCLDNGYDLLPTVINYEPNLILLDIMLGGIDGRDLCQQLKHNPSTKHIPIIIISASHTIYSSGDKSCEAEAFISKPFDINYLIRQVETYVN